MKKGKVLLMASAFMFAAFAAFAGSNISASNDCTTIPGQQTPDHDSQNCDQNPQVECCYTPGESTVFALGNRL